MEPARDRIGRYHVLGRLAQGGMAEVYKVKTVGIAGFEKVQALKRILPHQAKEPRFIRSFVDEARIAVELSHRNIVQVFDFGEADGELYLAMELIEGKDLRTAQIEAAAFHLPLPANLAAYIIAEVGAGLEYAHRKANAAGAALGIVHCDVSPANVMLSTEGFIKILDFGVARASFASAVERRRLRGKPRYMAPEQTYGERPTPATDVFALGIVAWELLTGAPLFDGGDLKAILASVRGSEVPRVDELAPDVPDELVNAVARALRRDAAERGTAAELSMAAAATAAGAGPRALAAWLDELHRRSAIPEPVPEPPPAAAAPPAEPTTETVLTRGQIGTAPTAPTIEPGGTARMRRRLQSPATPDEEGPTRVHRQVPTQLAAALRELAGADLGQDPTRRELPAVDLAMHEPTRIEAPSFIWEGMDAADDDDASVAGMTAVGVGTMVGGIHNMASVDVSSESALEALTGERTSTRGTHSLERIGDAPAVSVVQPLGEHRRAVLVAALIDGGPEASAPLAHTLGELAYLRGGLVVADDPVVAFGLEIEGEDDAATALAFALDAQLAAREAAGPALRLGVRASVTLGGLLGGLTGVARPGVPSDALEEARALAREATPERPLLSGPAGRIAVAAFNLREQPSTPRRLHRRHRALEVAGRRTFDERARLIERRGRFVGRGRELGQLTAALEQAILADRRTTALVRGPAGAGKSRLIGELRAKASTIGVHVVAAVASPGSSHEPFGLLVELCLAMCDVPPDRGREARARARQRLARLLDRSGLMPDAAVEAIDAFETAMALREGAEVAARADLRAPLTACLTAVAASGRPGQRRLTIVEDLHFADVASVAVLRDWTRSPAGRGELVVMSARPELPPFAVDHALDLAELGADDGAQLAADRLGDGATAEQIAAVLARAGGLPLLIEEAAGALRDGLTELPPAARDVIAARAAGLSPRAKLVLQLASVLGEPLDTSMLEELAGARGLGPELDELVARGLFTRDAGDPATVRFASGLVREATADALSPRARRDAHGQIGRVQAARFLASREDQAAAVASNLELGGDRAGAAAFWLRAARDAGAEHDLGAALACYERALALEAELGGEPPPPASVARRWEARLGREAILRARGELDRNADDLDELARLAGDDAGRLAEVAVRRAARLVRRGAAAGDSASADAVVRADAAGDDGQRAVALITRGLAVAQRGRFAEARATLAQAASVARGRELDEVRAALAAAQVQLWRGAIDGARDAISRVLPTVGRTGDPELERVMRRLFAHVQLCLGSFADAAAHAARARELDERVRDRLGRCESTALAAAIAAQVGKFAEAAAGFGAALEPGPGPSWARGQALLWAGEAELSRGGPGARVRFGEALDLGRELRAPYLEARAWTGLAGAALGVDDTAAIEQAARGQELAVAADLGAVAALAAARRAQAAARLDLPAVADAAIAFAVARPEVRLLDSPCEEVWLRAAAACADRSPEQAAALREQARQSVLTKLRRLDDAEAQADLRAMPLYRGLGV